MKLVDLPPSHLLRLTPISDLRTLFPTLKTVNDLLSLDVDPATLPSRIEDTPGLFHELPRKHPLRNTPFKDLRVQSWMSTTKAWRTLRKSDSMNRYSYNTLPPLQRYWRVWRYDTPHGT